MIDSLTRIAKYYSENKKDITFCKISEGTGIGVVTIMKKWQEMIDMGIDLPAIPYSCVYSEENVQLSYLSYKEHIDILKNSGCRRIPSPSEFITEGLIALLYNGIDASTGDLIVNKKEIEVKSTILKHKDCTSFSPDSKEKDIYFVQLDIENDLYKVYILDFNLIDNSYVNKKETVKDQREQKRRPRLSLLDIINKNNIQPDKTGSLLNLKGDK